MCYNRFMATIPSLKNVVICLIAGISFLFCGCSHSSHIMVVSELGDKRDVKFSDYKTYTFVDAHKIFGISGDFEEKDYVLEFIENFKNGAGEMELFGEMKHGFYSDYAVLLLTDTLLSIRFTNSEYFSGAAHPNSMTQVFNYDITGGELIELADLFKPNGPGNDFCLNGLRFRNLQHIH